MGFSCCATLVHDCADEEVETPVEITGKDSQTDGIPFEAEPVSSTQSGSSTESASRLEGFLESFEEFGKMELEAMSLMTDELSQQSYLVDANEVIGRKPLCSTSHCQISTLKWRGQTVAVKELNVNRTDAARLLGATRDLMQEINIMRKISHPCLAKLLGANLDSKPFLLMEFFENRDVETYMRRQRQVSVGNIYQPRFALAKRWAMSTARALAFLHGLKHPIIHRDLKPLNLFLTRDLEVKLGDFGICKVMPRRHSMNSPPAPLMSGLVGTWRYMAPEVARQEQYNEKVDIFSFSLILYFIFSGKQPWFAWGSESEAILKAYIEGKEPRPSLDCIGSCELQELLANLWHRDPEERLSAEQCLERLKPMKPPGLRDTLQRWTRRKRR